MMFEIGIGLLALGGLFLLVGALMFLVKGFKVSVLWGLGILVLGPLAGIFFVFRHFKKTWSPALISILGAIMIPASVFVAPQDPELEAKMVKYLPFIEWGEVDGELMPRFKEVVDNARGGNTQVAGENEVAETSDDDVSDSPKGIGMPVMSFDPSEPLDPDHVEVRVVSANESDSSTPSGEAINIEPPSVTVNRELLGKPESAVTELLGKPLGMGSKKGHRYWMYADCMVSFDANRRVKNVEYDVEN